MKSPPKEKVRYPMPCPQCRRIIDARVHRCPYCGVNTDVILKPWTDAVAAWLPILPLLLIALAIAAGLWARTGQIPYALLGGIALGMVVAGWLKRRS